ncbi:MAG TPA: MarC family protein [Thermoplasmata archaeon]|nr:MarC family protein [Thermoplasmata archaeon]
MLEDFGASFIRMIILVDPLTTLAFFLALTPELSRKERNRVIKKASIASSIFLIGFGVGGFALLHWMGISLESLMIAGGLLLGIVGIDMLLHGIQPGEKTSEKREDISIVPLALPSIAGPGAITLSIVLMRSVEWYLVILAILLAIIMCAVCLYFAEFIQKALGEDGNKALTRIMGLITVAFAVQYVLDGLEGWVATWI